MDSNIGGKQEGFNDRVWEGGGVFTFVCAVYFVILLLFVALRVSAFFLSEHMSRQGLEIFFTVTSQILIMTVIPFAAMFYYKRKQAKTRAKLGDFSYLTNSKGTGGEIKSIGASFGFNRPSGRVIAYAFLLGLLIYFFNIFVAGFFNGILSLLGYRFPGMGAETFSGVGGLFITLFFIAVLPGVCEEVTHRGFLLGGFIKRLGVMRAVFFTSLLFGFMHLNIVQFFYAAILGYIIALAVLATRSLWVGIIMHFMNNGVGTYFSFASRNGWPGGNFLQDLIMAFAGAGLLVFVLLVGLIAFAIMKIIHMFARENFLKGRIEEYERTGEQGQVFMRPGMTWLGKMKAYLEYDFNGNSTRRQKLNAKEATLFYGIIFLGSIITIFTLVWGFL